MTKTLLSDADVARLVPPLRGKFVVWDAGYSHQVFDAAGQPTYQSSYARGDGRLGVLVTAKGHKSWVFRYWHKGRARWVTIGSAKNIKVEDARFKALVLIDKVRF